MDFKNYSVNELQLALIPPVKSSQTILF